jgi:hypothetical protein
MHLSNLDSNDSDIQTYESIPTHTEPRYSVITQPNYSYSFCSFILLQEIVSRIIRVVTMEVSRCRFQWRKEQLMSNTNYLLQPMISTSHNTKDKLNATQKESRSIVAINHMVSKTTQFQYTIFLHTLLLSSQWRTWALDQTSCMGFNLHGVGAP